MTRVSEDINDRDYCYRTTNKQTHAGKTKQNQKPLFETERD